MFTYIVLNKSLNSNYIYGAEKVSKHTGFNVTRICKGCYPTSCMFHDCNSWCGAISVVCIAMQHLAKRAQGGVLKLREREVCWLLLMSCTENSDVFSHSLTLTCDFATPLYFLCSISRISSPIASALFYSCLSNSGYQPDHGMLFRSLFKSSSHH